MQTVKKSFGFLRTTALGGVLFLLPLAVTLGLLAYVFQFVLVVYEPLKKWIPVTTVAGIGLLFALAVGVLLLVCFAAGIMARRAIGRKFSRTVEKQLMTVFPKYAIYKDLLAGNLGGSEHLPSLKPVLVRLVSGQRIAFESDRLDDGTVVVYFPGAPDAWMGSLDLVEPDRVRSLDVPFAEVLGIFERLGRDSRAILSKPS